MIARTYRGERVVVDWRYYGERVQDDVVPTRLAELWRMPVVRPPLSLEGGNLLTDGHGRCVVSEHLLSENPRMSEDAVREVLRDYAGCRRTTIVPPLAEEPTGHADMLAIITGPRRVMVGRVQPGGDPVNAARLDLAASLLQQDGFLVRRIPMPDNADGTIRSYTNALLTDDAVIVPIYTDDRSHEVAALAAFASAFPRKRVVTVDATNVIGMGGVTHCATMTIPHPD
jgi:agmatine deiminase